MVRALVILDDESSRRTTAKAQGPVGPLSLRQQRLQIDLQRWITEAVGEHQYELRRSLEPPPEPELADGRSEAAAGSEQPERSASGPQDIGSTPAPQVDQAQTDRPNVPPSTADPPQASSIIATSQNEEVTWLVFIEWSLLLPDPNSKDRPQGTFRSAQRSANEKLERFRRILPISSPDSVKIFLLLPETSEAELLEIRSLQIADVFSTPIDPSLFKQKLQFWSMSDGKKASPAHLFRRASQQRILLGKDVVLDQINEVRGEFINPRRLRRGMIVWLHAAELGHGLNSRLAGQVVDVEPEGAAYRVALRWIGITSTQLQNFRRMTKEQRGRAQKSLRPPKARLPIKPMVPESVDSTSETLPFHLVIIDPDPMSAKLASSSLEEISKLKLQSFSGLSRFLRKFTRKGSTESISPSSATPNSPTPAAPAPSVDGTSESYEVIPLLEPLPSLWQGPIEGRLRAADEVVLELKVADTDRIAGQSLDRWTGESKLWETLFQAEDLDEWHEQVRWLSSQSSQQSIQLQLPLPVKLESGYDRPIGAQWNIQLRSEVGEREKTITFKLHWETGSPESKSSDEASTQDLKAQASQPVDAIAIDLNLLGADAQSRVTAVRTLRRELENREILNSFGRVPPVIVLVDEKLPVGFEDFESLTVENPAGPSAMTIYFHRKIYDRHLIAQLFLDVAPETFHHPGAQKERLVAVHTATTLTQAYSSVSLAEYGLELQMPFALQRGAGLRLFSDDLEFGDSGVWAKCVNSAPNSENRGQGTWINEFVFFGSVERVQQKLRAWIRREYAKEKAAQSS